MKNIIKIIAFAALAAIWLGSCKPVEVLRQDELLSMPSQFSGSQDTTNAAAINWRQFFDDPNLVSLIDTALANNLDLKIALQRIQFAQADVLESKAPLQPIVDGVAGAGVNKFGRYTMDGAGNRGTEIYNGKDVPVFLPDFSVGLVASWEIDIWGKLRNRKKAAFNRYLASIEGRNFVQTSLVAAVAQSYYELQALDAQTAILQEAIALQSNALEVVRVQKEAGKATQLGVQQFEAQLLNMRGQQLELRQQIFEAEAALNFLLGRYPQRIVRTGSLLSLDAPSPVATGIPAALLENRPDVRQAALELAASKADLNAARALFYPSVNISGILGMQAFRPDFLLTKPQSLTFGLLGGLSAPLVNKRAIRAEFNRANANQIEALYNYQRTILNGYVEVNNQVASINNLRDVYGLKNEEVQVLLQSIDTSSDLFRTGRASYLEVLAAQQNTLDARLEMVELKKRQLQVEVGIYRSLGGGWR